MKTYFDKKFWKMLSGFVSILALSALIMFSTRVYQEKQLEKHIEVNLANPAN